VFFAFYCQFIRVQHLFQICVLPILFFVDMASDFTSACSCSECGKNWQIRHIVVERRTQSFITMADFVVNVPCGHVSVSDNVTCEECGSTNDYTTTLPAETVKCDYEGCMYNACCMFVPCGCVIFCSNHAEAYIETQPCHQVLCPKFSTGDCCFHIDTVVDIIKNRP